MLLEAGPRVGWVWDVSGGFVKSSRGQAPKSGDKGVKAFVSQLGAEVARLVAGLQWN